MKIKPIFDRVVLVPKKEEHHNLYLPKTEEEQPTIAVVIACGEGLDNEKMMVKEGDEVLFNPYACHYFTLEKETYILLKQKDILGIISKEDNHE